MPCLIRNLNPLHKHFAERVAVLCSEITTSICAGEGKKRRVESRNLTLESFQPGTGFGG